MGDGVAVSENFRPQRCRRSIDQAALDAAGRDDELAALREPRRIGPAGERHRLHRRTLEAAAETFAPAGQRAAVGGCARDVEAAVRRCERRDAGARARQPLCPRAVGAELRPTGTAECKHDAHRAHIRRAHRCVHLERPSTTIERGDIAASMPRVEPPPCAAGAARRAARAPLSCRAGRRGPNCRRRSRRRGCAPSRAPPPGRTLPAAVQSRAGVRGSGRQRPQTVRCASGSTRPCRQAETCARPTASRRRRRPARPRRRARRRPSARPGRRRRWQPWA